MEAPFCIPSRCVPLDQATAACIPLRPRRSGSSAAAAYRAGGWVRRGALSSGAARIDESSRPLLSPSVRRVQAGVRRVQAGVPRVQATVPGVQVTVPGFTQLGEEVPAELTLQEVVRSLPPEVFEVDDLQALRSVAVTVTAVAAGYAALAVAPWYLYPAVYAYLGTAVTGLFVIGHDCGHNSFSRNQAVNDAVGTLAMAPLVYPFEAWRIKHNAHHAHTNKLLVDTAWQPFRPHQYDRAGPGARAVMAAVIGPLWWMASIGHWLLWHFDLGKYRPQEKARVRVSLAAVAAFGVLVLVPLMVTQGPLGFVKWWLAPWLGFHFWMSTFTLVHHTAPHIPFKRSRDWSAVAAQLNGTVHCEYPAWVDFLCHDISVHIPHHVSTRIPSYRLRTAYAALQRHWDKHLNKAVFGPPLIGTIISECNLFDADKSKWVKFDKLARDPPPVAAPPQAVANTLDS